MPADIRHIVFDLDGTLVQPFHLDQAFIKTAVEAGADPDLVEDTLRYRFRGQHHMLSFSEVLPTFSQEQLLPLIDSMWVEVGNKPGSPLDGAARALAAGEAHGCNMFLSTGSSPALMEQTLHVHGWNELFLLACGSSPDFDKGEHHLPALADVSELSLNEFAAHALTVGDGATEMRHGLALGMPYRVALVEKENSHTRSGLIKAGANLVISDIGQLADILESNDPLSETDWRP